MPFRRHPPDAMDNGRSTYIVDPIACEGCGLCARVCTPGAVELSDAQRGEWFVSDTRHGPLVHARLDIGGENSGKLVTLVETSRSSSRDRWAPTSSWWMVRPASAAR